MDTETIRQHGYDAGLGAALGCERTLTGESDKTPTDQLILDASDAEENARQYTHFAIMAGLINASEDPEALWDAYERGVSLGIAAGVAQRLAAGGDGV